MPVLSPHRSSTSALTGSYRSTFNTSSTIDRPYFSSSSYNPRISSYSERFSSRSYSDSDGRRIYSRSGSITEDGITSRFREEARESSVRRDSLSRDTIRENSIADFSRRDGSLPRENGRLSTINMLDSVAELRNRYSPANYVPTCMREKNENIARSKSINDIGLPPIESAAGRVANSKLKKVTNNVSESNLNNGVPIMRDANNTNNDDVDANGNSRASVADLRRKFDEEGKGGGGVVKAVQIEIEGVRIAENRFKKQDRGDLDSTSKTLRKSSGRLEQTSENDSSASKSDVVNDSSSSGVVVKNGVRGVDDDLKLQRNGSRTNNFASYIPSKDYQQQQQQQGIIRGGEEREEDGASTTEYKRLVADISTSPKLSSTSSSSSTSRVSPSLTSSSTASGGSLSRRSVEGAAAVGGLNGLKNIGNTCFMNSVIQCLSNTRLLLEYLLKDVHLADVNTTTSGMKGALMRAFAEVIKELWSEDASDRVVNTTALKSQIQRFAPRFIGYAQQDAQEFLRYLLEGLHEDVNRVKEKPKPIVTEIDEKLSDVEKSSESWSRYLRMDNSKIVDYFVGQLKSTLKCTHCGHCSVTFDPFWDLSLPIPQRAGQVRLSQCLDSFTREETLDGDEKPTCSKCKERRKCTKSFTIQKFPKILVIHLKRFSLAERFRGKLSVTVDFPLEGLDMSNYAADHVTPCRYNLYAISNHSGTTYSGHYTAYCRHPYTKTWHEYNDSRVSPISSKSIVSGEAYVLFYEQEGQKSHL